MCFDGECELVIVVVDDVVVSCWLDVGDFELVGCLCM